MTSLKELKKSFNTISDDVEAIKVGTESELMDIPEIALLQSITHKEIVCKIGGAEARTDINRLYRLGISRFVAPMIESDFAVFKFITAIETTIKTANASELCLNIESKAAFSNLDNILDEAKHNINRINVGFSDFAASMNTNVCDHTIIHLAKTLKNHCKLLGINFSFGGSVTPNNIQMRINYLQPHSFETRLLIFRGNIKNPSYTVMKALEFEKEFERYLIETEHMLTICRQSRITSIEKRLNELQLAV